MADRWLTIVGIGEDGLDGLTDLTKSLIANAEVVFGGERHLRLVRGMNLAEQRRWQSPIETSIEEVARLRGRKRVCVLASGDPFHYGIGATLARRIPAVEMLVITSPSSFSLAAARMGWPLQDVTTLSLHGRPIELVLPHLHPGRKILALTSDETEPARISGLLTEAGFGRSAVTVLDALGGPHEKVRTTLAQSFDIENISSLNVLAIDILADENARIVPLTPGLPDDWFSHDGQITKREIRALTLSALSPRRGELLWDIGAGSGSVGIEWMLSDPSLSAIAIEADPIRSARIADNAALMGVPGLTIRVGRAPQVLEKLEQPDAIFIGGGGTEDGVIDAAIAVLKPGGRLVANAVTLEMEALLALLHQQMGGSLTRVQIARAEPLGTMSGWRPAMPVTQWVWVK
ncbi:bifunctional cobalt-precorrin-7 (C(5))-methyltransferase/cobalt-precorrin-6B (C(15))-methyltransferase [Pelagibacterium halotolerans]|uniref:Cobalt-precorrin-6y C5-methyltransferase / cobalt-precorrin-6y C15-methyltransferase (Decarboxylating) n=1 Tax=Pelagibacterium halotolerans (strain DSM 22347 / JCM 15775 / CGMCC 1.7692 / B2) TaxID=1082931 RepID=G4RF94_PELHB|nr:bifunctional cobalt-precorrin-7 (C(5))-methyltransferase/cobalt-precorrin-6B (C(15))-methyltransferase [Pelagibacterium halotolerans]AEQ50962.1 cobalt-precorrin-6y C5-methyltransferase / cobalt-precorrin-6y C15-methyltransferase (decarboxylating) [Pelagibacterium halotolerans B2]QJR19142.1 bifunctional cobalt-precorrin-7 (C(5))-methyltransferase/cobalt-precorrin-6B (C(15))-methyltransferase [Pelagibacterium halotolerans]SEA01167.1 precorrin-6Y C5,15-methyltransferase (decarboxylating) [Pelagi